MRRVSEYLFLWAVGGCLYYSFELLRCAVFVTALEFITGIIVNKWLRLEVWDYTDMPFQILGQVCLPFTIIFAGLCAVGIVLSGYLAHWLYGEPRPWLHVF